MNLPLKAKVQNGRFVLEDPTTELPEGTVVELYPADDEDDMDPEERARLDAFLQASAEEIKQGKVVTREELKQRLAKIP
jgi:hypothetical protein